MNARTSIRCTCLVVAASIVMAILQLVVQEPGSLPDVRVSRALQTLKEGVNVTLARAPRLC